MVKSGISTINEAINAKTPTGAASIIMSIIFKITSFNPLKKPTTGSECFGSTKIIPIPNRIVNRITCNILALSVKA